MNKLIVFLLVLVIDTSFAQNKFTTSTINAFGAVGFNSLIKGYGSNASYTPTIILGFEKGIFEAGDGIISLGGVFEYQRITSDVASASYKINQFFYAGKMAYYLDLLNKERFQIYPAFQLGYFNNSQTISISPAPKLGPNTGLRASLLLGGRIYLSDEIAIMSEFGYDLTLIKFGAVYNFK